MCHFLKICYAIFLGEIRSILFLLLENAVLSNEQSRAHYDKNGVVSQEDSDASLHEIDPFVFFSVMFGSEEGSLFSVVFSFRLGVWFRCIK